MLPKCISVCLDIGMTGIGSIFTHYMRRNVFGVSVLALYWLGMRLRIVMHDLTQLGRQLWRNYEIIVTYRGKCAMIGVPPKLCCPALRGHACPPIPLSCCPFFAWASFGLLYCCLISGNVSLAELGMGLYLLVSCSSLGLDYFDLPHSSVWVLFYCLKSYGCFLMSVHPHINYSSPT